MKHVKFYQVLLHFDRFDSQVQEYSIFLLRFVFALPKVSQNAGNYVWVWCNFTSTIRNKHLI